MKEKYFKVTESIGGSVLSMTDKAAGKFIKSVCDYVFNGKIYSGKDKNVLSNFAMAKQFLDAQARDAFYGRLGAIKTNELKRKEHNEDGPAYVGRVIVGGDVGELLKDICDVIGGKDSDDEG